MPEKLLHLELMTFEEIERALENGARTAIIPCGAIEQHGPHLPLCMDSDHADRLGVELAKRIENAVIAPTIRVGCSSHHMGFAGTISLRPATFEAICTDYCVSLAKHGFRKLILFSGHIGNFPYLEQMLPRLRSELPPECIVEAFVDSQKWLQVWKQAVTEAGGDGEAVGGHADIAETALMLLLRPESVRMGLAEPGRVGLLGQAELQEMWRHGLRAISQNGILGDARGASVEIGERCLQAIAEMLAEEFRVV